eukprot:CAMPEP_0183309950 /NCGR_PEP_ID=MMETSP0160_2-20130417/27531_1 /TAXON_ID=2839 ORGANISM="Odontella Sinensis, Strain Grunow 1884" /NCGR_SAMPLE_ID=MMETSP0160_2 /ASSEMBLY_ACC=CAM_ASM_000250 /LENGTH=157 /DNA_ID=CAMNT_0025474061 /DNA_START=67 /DNA_END=540 /DNA_ORIENTATION=+
MKVFSLMLVGYFGLSNGAFSGPSSHVFRRMHLRSAETPHEYESYSPRTEFAFEVNAFDALLGDNDERFARMRDLMRELKKMKEDNPIIDRHTRREQREVVNKMLEEAANAVTKIEEMKKLIGIEKKISKRFGTTEYGTDGFLAPPMGKEEEATGLWP